MPYIDISRILNSEIAVWPGDTPFNLSKILKMNEGHAVNLATLTLSAHTGSHIDAPLHFVDGGTAVDQLGLQPFWGRAQVVSMKKTSGPLFPEDFESFDLTLARRILVHSNASEMDPNVFPADFVYPSPELAQFLGENGIILYGTDAPSMDDEDSKSLDGHKALNKKQISILEGLDLSQAPDGLYELVALPLKIRGGDGSPVRAVLRTINAT